MTLDLEWSGLKRRPPGSAVVGPERPLERIQRRGAHRPLAPWPRRLARELRQGRRACGSPSSRRSCASSRPTRPRRSSAPRRTPRSCSCHRSRARSRSDRQSPRVAPGSVPGERIARRALCLLRRLRQRPRTRRGLRYPGLTPFTRGVLLPIEPGPRRADDRTGNRAWTG